MRAKTRHRNGRKPKVERKLNPTQKSAIGKTELGAVVASAPDFPLLKPQVKSAAVSRRRFIGLLTGLPLIGGALVLCDSIASSAFLPPGLARCKTCGEYNGSTDKGNLGLGKHHQRTGDIVTVSCLCHGIPCKYCGKLKHLPISNSYDP